MIGSAGSNRPSFDSLYMDLARGLARRSTCLRLAVGCAIVSSDYRYVYGVGYNGNASGLPNTCDSDAPGACGCLHAECNAVINCNAPRSASKIVIVTHQPCKMCAKMLINLGNVQSVLYSEPYRLRDGVEALSDAGIVVSALIG